MTRLQEFLGLMPFRRDRPFTPQLTPLVEHLTRGGAARRQAAVAAARSHLPALAQEFLVERLIGCLRRRSASTCPPVLDSLAALGDVAIPTLCKAYVADSDPVVRARILQALSRTGPSRRYWRWLLAGVPKVAGRTDT